jgi:hypothetical protein
MTIRRETRTPLSLQVLVSLTDVAQALFSATYDIERDRKAELKTRLTTELARFDLFGVHEHYADHEGYVPDGSEP